MYICIAIRRLITIHLIAKVLKYDGTNILLQPECDIAEVLNRRCIDTVELTIDDGRTISIEQRKKIFAIIRDIALWVGDDPEVLRLFLTWEFITLQDIDYFSLHDVDMTTAREFIDYLIDFCFTHAVPTKDTLLNLNDDIGKYLYMCLYHRKCAVCNMPAELHHVDRVGMGRNRKEIAHIGMKAVALCHEHHMDAHHDEKRFFADNHIYGIKIDKQLCERLSLRQKKKGI